VKNLGLDDYVAPPTFSDDPSALTRPREFPNPAGRIIFANEPCSRRDCLIRRSSVPSDFHDAFGGVGKAFRPAARTFHDATCKLGSAKLGLAQVPCASCTFLFVPRGVEIRDPFEYFIWSREIGVPFSRHTLIIAEDNSRVTLLEHFISANPKSADSPARQRPRSQAGSS